MILVPGYDVFGAFGHRVGYIHVLEVVVGVGEDVVSMNANQAMVAVALECRLRELPSEAVLLETFLADLVPDEVYGCHSLILDYS